MQVPIGYRNWDSLESVRKRQHIEVQVPGPFTEARPSYALYAKLLGGVILAYALSPIDLIPDFIPVLGYLDDLILLPAGILLLLQLIPAEVMEEYRIKAENPELRISGELVCCLALALGHRAQHSLYVPLVFQVPFIQ